jgi:cysteine sulfinate desulfinase/cysteine desulfurase-like protein
VIYLDNNATTQLLPSVQQKMMDFLKDNQFDSDQFLYVCVKTRKTA